MRQQNDAKSLYCTNPECQAKRVKSFALFVSRDALNVDGLSEATLEKFIAHGFIHKYADIFYLHRYQEQIQTMEGFGEKSYENLIQSVEAARETTLAKVIYGLGISGIGLANAKVICREFDNDIQRMLEATEEDLSQIQGVGPVMAHAFVSYFKNEQHKQELLELLEEVKIPREDKNENELKLKDMIFVVTGSVNHFANRNELKEVIENLGGKVTGSVTGKTNYLINNDVNSTSSKNKKARELGVPILSEEDFLELIK